MCPTPETSPSGQPLPARLRLIGAMQTHPGPNGALNEDVAVYVLPHPDEPFARNGALALVADGMGGHEKGDVASAALLLKVWAHAKKHGDSGPIIIRVSGGSFSMNG